MANLTYAHCGSRQEDSPLQTGMDASGLAGLAARGSSRTVCASVGIIAAYRIPWECIFSQSRWKHFQAMGRSPGFDRVMWKHTAVERCRFLQGTSTPRKASAAGEACLRSRWRERYELTPRL